MTFHRITLAAGMAALLSASAGTAFAAASATDSRQDRMDAAYQNYQARSARHQSSGRMSHHASRSHQAMPSDTAATGNVREDARRFGTGMKRGAKHAGHAIAEGARETGHAFKETGKRAKDAVTGDSSSK